MVKLIVVAILAIAGLAYYFVGAKSSDTQRWYTKAQVQAGKKVFAANCASCHGFNAEKTVNWRKKLADGSYPPPALNGTAHAWHHTFAQLMTQINDGGEKYGGKMPAFRGALSEDEEKEVISYFQSFWNDKTYSSWKKRNDM